MADPVRRYLAFQRDLGGDEVILDRAITEGLGTEAPRAEQRARPEPGATTAGQRAVNIEQPTTTNHHREVTASAPTNQPAWLKDAPPIPGPGLSITSPAATLLGGGVQWETLDEIAGVVAGCTKCPLCEGRTNAVPGEGNPSARLMVVGEGPGESEDRTGRPFVGRAGELLDKILDSIEVPRKTVYIANVVKCRPPKNRAPLPDERAACLPYLHRQIALVKPKVLLALGGTAAEAMLGAKRPLGEMRLKVHRWDGIPLIVTYHPAALLRNPNWKRPAWDDVRIVRQLLDLDA